ncbi:unnamed protein product [Mycena citricolor]|uniref:Xylanolytic transcriptional activator regulatory domain-containing protein n=1 Tax=Mycena citricolor TaxID=2018698 RepID=A0AAD2GYN0_9AGAR|nr:unnamed protein product [Mycena citricolor]
MWTSFPMADTTLSQTVETLAKAVPASDDSSTILQTVQGQIIVSYYCLDTGWREQGMNLCGAALSLGSWAGISASDTNSSSTSLERNKAFWALFLLHNLWVASFGVSSSLPYDPRDVSVPWPCSGRLASGSQFPIAEFLDAKSDVSTDSATLFLQASILLQQVVTFCMERQGKAILELMMAELISETGDKSDADRFAKLQTRLRSFVGHLPPLVSTEPIADEKYQVALITRCLLNASVLRLHAFGHSGSGTAPAVDSAARAASNRFVSDIRHAQKRRFEWVDPVLGPLLSTACFFNSSNASRVPEAVSNIRTLASAMSICAGHSTLIQQCWDATISSLHAQGLSSALF